MKIYTICLFLLFTGVMASCSDAQDSDIQTDGIAGYSIKGKVVDENGIGIPQVEFKIGNRTVYSNAEGVWCANYLQGTVEVIPSHHDFLFFPSQLNFSATDRDVLLVGSAKNDRPAFASNLLAWLKSMQLDNGLIASVEYGNTISLYDNALAALSYIAMNEYSAAERIFDYFNQHIESEFLSGTGGFYQFRDISGKPSGDRWAGDNAWLLIALNNYASKVNAQKYNNLSIAIETWLRGLQDADGGVWGGTTVDGTRIDKVTENMIDVYAAVRGYDEFHRSILSFLKRYRYDTKEKFLVASSTGRYQYALDNHAWGYCAFEDFPISSLNKTSIYQTTQKATLNGVSITGFAPDIDKDIVWLEGMGMMVVAFQKAQKDELASTYLNETEKLFIPSRKYLGAMGLPYVSNFGTTFGNKELWTGADTQICVSATAWCLFSLIRFDPMASEYHRGATKTDKFWLE